MYGIAKCISPIRCQQNFKAFVHWSSASPVDSFLTFYNLFIIMKGSNFIAFLIMVLVVTGPVTAGPVAAGICYAGCATVVVACFAAAGFTFGTVPGAQIAAVPALAGCNTAFGACEAACVAALLVPTP